MEDKLKLIAITPEKMFDQEINYITTILDSGFDYVHIRKPLSSTIEIKSFIKNIPPIYHSRLKLHNDVDLAMEYNLAGVHLNSKCKYISNKYDNLLVSKSCHSVDEIKINNSKYEYMFLSPIYDSISKKGYTSNFDLKLLKNEINNFTNIVALGGIDDTNLLTIKKTGFFGAAFLGYLFEAKTLIDLTNRINSILLTLRL